MGATVWLLLGEGRVLHAGAALMAILRIIGARWWHRVLRRWRCRDGCLLCSAVPGFPLAKCTRCGSVWQLSTGTKETRIMPSKRLWWIDYGAGELVREADNARWRVEDIPPLAVVGAVDLDAVDQWVIMQPRNASRARD